MNTHRAYRLSLLCAVGASVALVVSRSWAGEQNEALDLPVTFEFAETPLKDVLEFFAKEIGLNFAWATRPSEETPVVTARMLDVPARTAIQAIATAAGLRCEFMKGNVAVLTVKGQGKRTGREETSAAEPREGPLFTNGFERSLEGWYAPHFRFEGIEIDGKAKRADREEDVKVGKGSLEWSYDYGPDRLSAIIRPARLDKAVQELRFWMKTENAGVTLVMGLKERDESEYHAALRLDVEGRWDLHRITPAEFSLDEDSEDENNALDLDQVREISFADATGMFLQAAGQNTIWLDEFTVE